MVSFSPLFTRIRSLASHTRNIAAAVAFELTVVTLIAQIMPTHIEDAKVQSDHATWHRADARHAHTSCSHAMRRSCDDAMNDHAHLCRAHVAYRKYPVHMQVYQISVLVRTHRITRHAITRHV